MYGANKASLTKKILYTINEYTMISSRGEEQTAKKIITLQCCNMKINKIQHFVGVLL